MRGEIPDLEDMRTRFAEIHGKARADHMVAAALFGASVAVYEAAMRRVCASENELHLAIAKHDAAKEKAHEWQCMTHGLALQLARFIDKKEKRT